MAINVLVITEDHTHDQYVAKPLIEAMFWALHRRADVTVCREPRFQGIDDALNWPTLQRVIDRQRGMYTFFLLLVDRDGNPSRAARLRDLEQRAAAAYPHSGVVMLCEHAWQEMEAWLLTGLRGLDSAWRWQEIRAERDAKERYFEPYAKKRGMFSAPGQGREVLGIEAAKRYAVVRGKCPELADLEARIAAQLALTSRGTR